MRRTLLVLPLLILSCSDGGTPIVTGTDLGSGDESLRGDAEGAQVAEEVTSDDVAPLDGTSVGEDSPGPADLLPLNDSAQDPYPEIVPDYGFETLADPGQDLVPDSGPETVMPCGLAGECGMTGDGLNCGTCSHSWPCVNNRCQCQPECTGKCGSDLCGGSCGTCSGGQVCDRGACVAPSCPSGFALAPAGVFVMGSPPLELGRRSEEYQRTVTISRAFCILATEVTSKGWESIVGTPVPSPVTCTGGKDCPVQVRWIETLLYCNERSMQESLAACYELTGCTGTVGKDYTCASVTFAGLDCEGYRLPTQAEWEYAARAGTTMATYNGDLPDESECAPNVVLDPIAWFCGTSGKALHPVAGKTPNPWGLYDVLGNGEEWCLDVDDARPFPVHAEDPYSFVSLVDTHHVVRGGGYQSVSRDLRSAARSFKTGESWTEAFRPVRTMKP